MIDSICKRMKIHICCSKFAMNWIVTCVVWRWFERFFPLFTFYLRCCRRIDSVSFGYLPFIFIFCSLSHSRRKLKRNCDINECSYPSAHWNTMHCSSYMFWHEHNENDVRIFSSTLHPFSKSSDDVVDAIVAEHEFRVWSSRIEWFETFIIIFCYEHTTHSCDFSLRAASSQSIYKWNKIYILQRSIWVCFNVSLKTTRNATTSISILLTFWWNFQLIFQVFE